MAWNRILIADENPAIRQTLIEMLYEDSEIVAAVDNEEAVEKALEALKPDVIVLGVRLKGTTGFDIARHLRQANCPAKIIIVSLHESTDLVRAAFAMGVSGYVFMSRMLDDLPAAVNAVCEGNLFEPD